MNHSTKRITIPIDGSKNSLRPLNYLSLIFGAKHDIKVSIYYILPALPLIFEDEKTLTKEERQRLRAIKNKNIKIAERILEEAKELLIKKGFDESCIKTAYHQKKQTVAKDVRHYALEDKTNAILMARHGRTELRAPFMGEVSRYMVEYCQNIPVWVLGGVINSKKFLICVDSSDNSLRAVNHAGLMLAGTDCRLTIFHTIRHIRRFIPEEVLNEAPEFEDSGE